MASNACTTLYIATYRVYRRCRPTAKYHNYRRSRPTAKYRIYVEAVSFNLTVPYLPTDGLVQPQSTVSNYRRSRSTSQYRIYLQTVWFNCKVPYLPTGGLVQPQSTVSTYRRSRPTAKYRIYLQAVSSNRKVPYLPTGGLVQPQPGDAVCPPPQKKTIYLYNRVLLPRRFTTCNFLHISASYFRASFLNISGRLHSQSPTALQCKNVIEVRCTRKQAGRR